MAEGAKPKKNPVARFYLMERRYELNITQARVATLARIEPIVYNQIENGKRGNCMSAPKLIALAGALEWRVETLVAKEAKYLEQIGKT